MSNLIRLGNRGVQVHVSRDALRSASENSVAASRNASEAVDRAIDHIFRENRAGAIHELGRIGFELQGRMTALTHLTAIAESGAECPDAVSAPGHGKAA